MDLHTTKATIEHLEQCLGSESIHRSAIETLISELMDSTFRSSVEQEKVRLASLELRARLLLERWRKRGMN